MIMGSLSGVARKGCILVCICLAVEDRALRLASGFVPSAGPGRKSVLLMNDLVTFADDSRYWNGNSISDGVVFNGLDEVTRSSPITRYISPEEKRASQMTRSGPYGGYRDPRRRGPVSSSSSGNIVQGGSRKTFTPYDPYAHESQQVQLKTEGRPLNAEFEVWQGPNNTPQKVRVYSEDGQLRPFNMMVNTPTRTGSHSLSVRNSGTLEFPMAAGVGGLARQSLAPNPGRTITIDGGALKTFPFDHSVGSVQVDIHTQGLPLMADVELWQGPGCVKQIAQIYADDGSNRPFCAVIDTPGGGSTIAIRNRGPMTYPIEVSVRPHSAQTSYNLRPYYQEW